ncbi:MAG TPA: redoxin domain-containing protein [Gemmatimonadaceae bacterium]|jgi:peroxiredoxin Q/BCP|nr:redoxin domain-containing protein [Gemmatimonadaceae bacterium]
MNTTSRFPSSALSLACLLFAAAVALGSAGVLGAQDAAQAAGPKVGDMAPDFTLPAATKAGVTPAPVKLSDLRGQVVVLAFFPRARTGGCTAQMEAYRDQYATLFNGGKGVRVLAISTDDDTTLHAWAVEKDFPVTFVSDKAGAAGTPYDVMFDRAGVKFMRRVLFVVGPDGRIAHVMRPFRELSADAYTELGAAVKKASGG